MLLKIKLPKHPMPNHPVHTSLGDYTIIYSRRPGLRGDSFAIRAVSGLKIDMTGYYSMPELEARMANGIEFFSPGRRPEIAAIAEALVREGVATVSTDAVASLR